MSHYTASKSLPARLDSLLRHGFDRPLALEILKRDVNLQSGSHPASPYDDAITIGPEDFELGWYDLQNSPISGHSRKKISRVVEFLDCLDGLAGEHNPSLENTPHRNETGSYGQESSWGAARFFHRYKRPLSIAAVLGITLLAGCSSSQSIGQEHGQAVQPGSNPHYSLALLSGGKYDIVHGLSQGLSKIRDDRHAQALFIGDFSYDELVLYKGVIGRFSSVNPGILDPLEMVFVKVPITSNDPVALPNHCYSPRELEQMLKKILDEKNPKGIHEVIESSDGLRRDLVAVPVSAQGLEGITARIQKAFSHRNKDGYDIILVTKSVDDGNNEITKEICELLLSEVDAFDAFFEKFRGDTKDEFRLSLYNYVYIDGNRKQPEDWVKAEMAELDQLVEVYRQLTPEGRDSFSALLQKEKPRGEILRYQRVFAALGNVGIQQTKEMYERVLQEIVLGWNLRNIIAHRLADIVSKDFHYEAAMDGLEGIDEFRAGFQKIIGALQGAYSLEPDPRKKQELLEKLEDAMLGSRTLDGDIGRFMALTELEDVLTSWKPKGWNKK
ncbi:hypothetical protein HYV84_01735 [Candidatus Woesearchaeota archaeon]|nr:hypothetical protein [Candidatus Woesearchaeota archaeon]